MPWPNPRGPKAGTRSGAGSPAGSGDRLEAETDLRGIRGLGRAQVLDRQLVRLGHRQGGGRSRTRTRPRSRPRPDRPSPSPTAAPHPRRRPGGRPAWWCGTPEAQRCHRTRTPPGSWPPPTPAPARPSGGAPPPRPPRTHTKNGAAHPHDPAVGQPEERRPGRQHHIAHHHAIGQIRQPRQVLEPLGASGYRVRLPVSALGPLGTLGTAPAAPTTRPS
jgi:hypothetical protein